MICHRDNDAAPWRCYEIDGTPIPPDDPRVVATIEAFAQAAAAAGPAHAAAIEVAPDQAAARRSICLGCEHHRPDADRCGLLSCGCPISDRARRPWGTCPADRW